LAAIAPSETRIPFRSAATIAGMLRKSKVEEGTPGAVTGVAGAVLLGHRGNGFGKGTGIPGG
jgi:outer membrane lipoprotein SlyB